MITFINKHNCIFDEEELSDAVEWYAKLKGATLCDVRRAIFVDTQGYLCVSIGGWRKVSIHRLLMMHHLGRELSSKEFVHHRDGNLLNNVLSDLALTTNPEHTSYHHKRADILDTTIGEMLAQGRRQCDIASYFGCSQQVISYRVKRIKEEREICT